MTTAVVAAFVATVLAILALIAFLWMRARYERSFDAALVQLEAYTRTVSDELERALARATDRPAHATTVLELTLDFDALLARILTEAAARTDASATAIRVEGRTREQVVASFGAGDAAALLERLPVPPDTQPFRALTIGWTYRDHHDADANTYRSALLVAIEEHPDGADGILVACSEDADAFGPDHLRALEALAREVAPRLESARRLAEVEQRVTTDPATGIRNGNGYDLALERELALARLSGRPLSLVILHVGSPGETSGNDGRRAADAVLPGFAEILARVARETDIPCRVRRQEFAVLLPDTRAAGAHAFHDRLRAEAGSARSLHGLAVSAGSVEWRTNESGVSITARAVAAAATAIAQTLGETTSGQRPVG